MRLEQASRAWARRTRSCADVRCAVRSRVTLAKPTKVLDGGDDHIGPELEPSLRTRHVSSSNRPRLLAASSSRSVPEDGIFVPRAFSHRAAPPDGFLSELGQNCTSRTIIAKSSVDGSKWPVSKAGNARRTLQRWSIFDRHRSIACLVLCHSRHITRASSLDGPDVPRSRLGR